MTMPEPPGVSIFTRLVLENPYILGPGLLIVGIVLAWMGLREGRMDRFRLALIPLFLGVLILVVSFCMTTAGERARAVARQLTKAVVDEDLVAGVNLFSDDATLHLGSTRNVGHDLDFITAGLSRLADRYSIDDNRITMLKGYTESGDAAVVHLACWTEAGGYGGYTPSQWVLRIERQSDESWKITRVTCISISGKAPPSLPW